MTVRRQLINFGKEHTDFRVGDGAFDDLPRMLRGTVARSQRAVLVAQEEALELCGETVRRSLVDAGFKVSEFVVAKGEKIATMDRAVKLFEALDEAHITAEDLVVALGDADACALVTFCANSWCGGVPYVMLPTTLDAMASSPTVMRGLDSGDSFSMVSLRPHATLVVCELNLVLGRPIEEVGLGLVQIVAAYLCESRRYWDRIEEVVSGLAGGTAGSYMVALAETQTSRVNSIKATSPSARTALLFGYTTACALHDCLGPDVPEYQLLAEGMRFEARLASEVMEFPVEEVFRIDDSFEELGIEELPFSLDTDEFIQAIKAERFKRSNRFMLPLPKRAGFVRLTAVDDEVLERHADAYLGSREELLEELEGEGGDGEGADDEDAGDSDVDADAGRDDGSDPGADDSDASTDADAGYNQAADDSDADDADVSSYDPGADDSDADAAEISSYDPAVDDSDADDGGTSVGEPGVEPADE